MNPKFKIRADVFHYIVMVTVGAGGTYVFTQWYGESDEVKESNLRAKYPQQIRNNENQHAKMQQFFDQMKNSDKALDHKMSGVLKGGKGDMKRHYDIQQPEPQPVVPAPVTSTTTIPKNPSDKVTAEPSSPTITNGWWNGWGWW